MKLGPETARPAFLTVVEGLSSLVGCYKSPGNVVGNVRVPAAYRILRVTLKNRVALGLVAKYYNSAKGHSKYRSLVLVNCA